MRNYVVCNCRFYCRYPLNFIQDLYKEVKAFIQRGLRGYADCDSWSADCYLNVVIAGLVKRLRENSCGCPNYLVMDGEGNETADIDTGCQDWEDILLTIEETFRLNSFLFEEYSFTKDPNWKDDMCYTDFMQTDHDFLIYGKQLFILFFDALWD